MTRYLRPWLLPRRIGHFAQHLLHRKCTWCVGYGWARGYHEAAVEADADRRRRDAVWRSGIDPDTLEQFIRERAA